MFAPILLTALNPGPLTGSGNNTYLLADADEALLIDAGIGDARHLAAIARELSARRARLAEVIVTHAHADHAAGVTPLAEAHPAVSFAKYPWPSEDAKYAVAWRALADGDRVGELTVLHTPGHSPDHIALWHAPSGVILSGDLVALDSSVMIPWGRAGDLRQYLHALERLRRLSPSRLLPAHGPPIEEPAVLLTEYLEHRRMRDEQVLAALRLGRGTVERIVESIYDGLAPELVPAARETVRAHLEKLRAEGRAKDQEGRWTV